MIYYINVCAESELSKQESYTNYVTVLKGAEIKEIISSKQWFNDTDHKGKTANVQINRSNKFTCDFPARTVTHFQLRINNN